MRDVKAFLRWLTAEGDLEKTPSVPRVAQPLRHPEVLTDAGYKKLVVVAEQQHSRDALMVRVMGEAGLRASEVIGLREEDLLELTGGRYQLRVVGKGNKERLASYRPTWAGTFDATSDDAQKAAGGSSSPGSDRGASISRSPRTR